MVDEGGARAGVGGQESSELRLVQQAVVGVVAEERREAAAVVEERREAADIVPEGVETVTEGEAQR